MTQRISIIKGMTGPFDALNTMAGVVAKAAAVAGVDTKLLELVKVRASQINGCAYCLDMHTADALKEGEDARRLHVLAAWRETDLYTEQERAALELTEVLTRLAETNDVPEDVYEFATKVFTESQYQAVVWMVMVINAYNRIVLPGHSKLPKRTA
ncbi:carboxymuconolactone decarboxylase family protein [Actinophytocola algeriensis]|uniref:AhpD family alkylhydroperoxidase n=1 Tax=Actinophytocola algeriensis TaxID=1768010 RepID=A0A7W7Q9Z2_9PSEU|nr:carboxymuconolactone decarboxylase family protein [Actinophytocola algeriensis]MBB4909714.1 AhpD family alkylhydroperoxidase [Actinophytocola algeriensis]MBE1475704.1 AhpD family alkylhydroperoxidase [Actinophytocola algeriensis]